jgi:hypothetical protein
VRCCPLCCFTRAESLCELGAVAALKGLAELNDDLTKQRCLVAFANLSCEVTVQTKMIQDGILNIISGQLISRDQPHLLRHLQSGML